MITNMKYIVTFFLLSLFICFPAMSQQAEMSAEARQFKNSLMSFLREEGFSPSTDYNSNKVNFKREGESYWITLTGAMPVQVSFYINGFTNKDTNALALLLACNEVNKDAYYVKAYVDDFGDEGSTNIAIEMPCHSAEEFRYVFSEAVKSLAYAKNKIQESYNKNQEDLAESNKPFEVTACTIANVNKSGGIVTDYGNTIYSSRTKYLKPKLTIKSNKAGNYTIYFKLYTPNGTLSTGTNSPSGYSSSTSVYIYSGTRDYELSGWGTDTFGNWPAGTYKYEFYCEGANLGYYTFTIY